MVPMKNPTGFEYIGKRSKPNHADRAVDITTIWPEVPAGDAKRKQAAADAGARGVSAEPMTAQRREQVYIGQRTQLGLTPTVLSPRQSRRLAKKARALAVSQ